MQGCEILFTAEGAAEIRRELDKAMGQAPCVGCAAGRACPLLPADLGPLLTERTAALVD